MSEHVREWTACPICTFDTRDQKNCTKQIVYTKNNMLIVIQTKPQKKCHQSATRASTTPRTGACFARAPSDAICAGGPRRVEQRTMRRRDGADDYLDAHGHLQIERSAPLKGQRGGETHTPAAEAEAAGAEAGAAAGAAAGAQCGGTLAAFADQIRRSVAHTRQLRSR